VVAPGAAGDDRDDESDQSDDDGDGDGVRIEVHGPPSGGVRVCTPVGGAMLPPVRP